MEYILPLIFIFACVSQTYAGTCPKYPLIRDFEFIRYLGMWYQQDKKQAGWELPGRCWKSLYLRDQKNGQFKMRMIFENTITRREEKYDSQLSLELPEKPSVIKYSIPLTFLESEFQVLATDYETFSVEYKCDPNGILEKQESVFLLTREQNPSPLILQKAYAIMHRYGIDIRKLERVDQTCGGMKLASDAPDEALPHYEQYPIPNQNIQDNRYNQYSETEEGVDESEARYEYFDTPPVVTAHPSTVLKNYPSPPPIKRREPFKWNYMPTNRQVSFGAQLADQLKRILWSLRNK